MSRDKPLVQLNTTLPNDYHAELALAGALLLEWQDLKMRASDFFDPHVRLVFQAVREAVRRGNGPKVDILTVVSILSSQPDPNSLCSWMDFMIFDCIESCENVSLSSEYALRIKDCAERRRIVEKALSEIRNAYI